MSSSSATLDALTSLGREELFWALASFVVVLSGILGVGMILRRVILKQTLVDPVAEAVLVIGLGICGYGTLLVVLGFLPILNRIPLAGLSVVAGIGCAKEWPVARGLARDLVALVIGGARKEPVVVIPSLVLLGLAMAAGLRPPAAADEVAYHWAAPVLWAEAGSWVTTPFRFTNGFHLAEILYTPSAVFGSAISAHWLHTFTFALLALGTAALARSVGASGALAAGAMLAVPVAGRQSWWAYNDVFGASLLVAACVAACEGTDKRRMWVSGVLVAGAISVKPLLIMLAPVVLFVAAYDRHGRGASVLSLRGLRAMCPLAIPSVIVSLGWFVYTRAFTGAWFQSSGLIVAVFGDDPSGGLATIRLPTVLEVLSIPFVPLFTGVLGQQEPYGGRSGLVITLFVPIVIVTTFLMNGEDRRQLGRLAVPALGAYAIAALLVVRTRFLLSIYAPALASASLVVGWWQVHRSRNAGFAVVWAFRICVVVGIADSARLALS